LWSKNRLSPRFPKSKNAAGCPARCRVLALDHWMARLETVSSSLVSTWLISSESKVFAGAERL
jgi:hypothetical protein